MNGRSIRISEGIARRFAQEGAGVVVNDLNERGGVRVAGEIGTAGGKAVFVKSDVTHSGQWHDDVPHGDVSVEDAGSAAGDELVTTQGNRSLQHPCGYGSAHAGVKESQTFAVLLDLVKAVRAVLPLILKEQFGRTLTDHNIHDLAEETDDAMFRHVSRFDQT